MNWISNVVRPRIRSFLTTKREIPDNMWVKCPDTGQMVFYKDLEANQFVVPGSDYHMRMSADARLKSLFDNGAFKKVAFPDVKSDPLKFRDGRGDGAHHAFLRVSAFGFPPFLHLFATAGHHVIVDL